MNTVSRPILLFTFLFTFWTALTPSNSWSKTKAKTSFTTYQILELVPLGNAFDIRVKGRKKPLQIEEASKFDEEVLQQLHEQAEKKASFQFRLKGDLVLEMKPLKP